MGTPVSCSIHSRYARAFAGRSGQRRAARVGVPPPREHAPHRAHTLEGRGRGVEVRHRAAVALVGHRDADLVELIEHVELGDHHRVERIDAGRVAQRRQVEPAAAARPPGGGAVLLARRAQMRGLGLGHLARERAMAHARGVRLGHADHAIDRARAEADPQGRARRARGRGRDVRVGAVVEIEQGALRALEQHPPAGLQRRVKLARDVAHQRPQPRDGLGQLGMDGGAAHGADPRGVGGLARMTLAVALRRGDERVAVEQVADADPGAARLVAVRSTDPAAGGADRAGALLGHGLGGAVVGQDDVRRRAHAETRAHVETE